MPLILSGYYSSKYDAKEKQSSFLADAKSSGFNVKSIKIIVKEPTNSTSNTTDFWGNPTTSKSNESVTKPDIKIATPPKKVELDFWGNPIKN